MSDVITTRINGHVRICDGTTGEVLIDKNNAIHNKNMALALARGLANEPVDVGSGIGKHQIYKIKLGRGGSTITSSNTITFQPPNITGTYADLYAPTYEEVVDEGQATVPTGNSVTYLQNDVDDSCIVIVTATISAGEPTGQDISDSPPNSDPETQYAFDELGLFTYDNRLLTHLIFSPILKTANRELVITYTLTITVS